MAQRGPCGAKNTKYKQIRNTTENTKTTEVVSNGVTSLSFFTGVSSSSSSSMLWNGAASNAAAAAELKLN